MPLEIISVTAFICQQIIVDRKDNVITAIRLVDVFQISQDHPTGIVPFSFLVTVKSSNAGTARLGFRLFRPDGVETPLQIGLPNLIELKRQLPEAPCGHTLNVDFNIKVEVLGTHFIHLELDGALVARTPFTLLRK